MSELDIRRSIIENCLFMNRSGLNQGNAGNISARMGDTMLITPSSIPYEEISPDMIAAMPLEGDYGSWEGPNKPSTEWRFHLDIMKSRPEVGAVIHTHASFSTILAIARKPIPACHYMVAAFGGDDVRVANYARYGTKALSENVLEALQGRSACLMANHGMLVVGSTLKKAMWRAVELETIAKQYYHSLLIGGPVLLSSDQIAETMESFATYGLQEA
jgi:L-fuculose-phosphate aldolase